MDSDSGQLQISNRKTLVVGPACATTASSLSAMPGLHSAMRCYTYYHGAVIPPPAIAIEQRAAAKYREERQISGASGGNTDDNAAATDRSLSVKNSLQQCVRRVRDCFPRHRRRSEE